MGRIMMFNRVTADGYFAAPDGNLNWAVPDEQLDKEAAAASAGSPTGMMLFGRKTYEQFESFWPKALSDSGKSPDPHAPGKESETMHALAVWINNATKIVFSRTRKEVTWKNSRLIREFNPREIEALKKDSGSDMIIFGSGSIVSKLSEHRLIDEYQFVVSPLLLGAGQSMIRDMPASLRLELLEAKQYPSGNVKLRYAPAK